MVRTVPLMMMPSLYQVKRSKRGSVWSVLQLLLLFALVVLAGGAWDLATGGTNGAVFLQGVQKIANDGDFYSSFMRCCLWYFDSAAERDMEYGLVIAVLVLVVGSGVGYWTGAYGGASRCWYIASFRPKLGVVTRG